DRQNEKKYDYSRGYLGERSGLWRRPQSGQLDSSIVGNDRGDTLRNQTDRAIIITLLKERNSLAPEAANLAVWEDRLQSVAHRCPILSVFNGVQNQDATICGFAANSPRLVELHRIVKNIFPLERVDCDYRHLRLRFVVQLLADTV